LGVLIIKKYLEFWSCITYLIGSGIFVLSYLFLLYNLEENTILLNYVILQVEVSAIRSAVVSLEFVWHQTSMVN